MIRAAVIPYLHARAAVVVASGDAPSLTRMATESFEVGEIPGRPADGTFVPGLVRVVESSHIATVVAQLAEVVRAHGAGHVVIELPAEAKGKDAQKYARQIGGALAARLDAAGIPNEFEESRWRRKLDGIVQEHSDRALGIDRQAFDTWPDSFEIAGKQVKNEAVNVAGALLVYRALPELFKAATEFKPSGDRPVSHGAPRPVTTLSPPGDLAPTLQKSLEAAVLPPVAGVPRIAACDPGSGELTIVVGEGAEAPYHFVAGRTFETERRELTYEQAGELAVDAVTWLLKCGVKKLLLEHVKNVTFGPGAPYTLAAIATGLVRTARVTTSLALMALAKGIEVVPVDAKEWRYRVVGKTNPKDETIAPLVRAGFADFPDVSNVHLRDAGGLALFGLLPPLAEKPPKEPKAPRRPRDPNAPPPKRKRDRDESRRKRYDEPNQVAARKEAREKAATERAAMGCKCTPGRRHRRECPLFRAKVS